MKARRYIWVLDCLATVNRGSVSSQGRNRDNGAKHPLQGTITPI